MKKLVLVCPTLGRFLFCGEEVYRVHVKRSSSPNGIVCATQSLVQLRPVGDGTPRTTWQVTSQFSLS